MKRAAFLFSSILISSGVLAQDFWQTTGIFSGGQVLSLFADREGAVYAGAWEQGVLVSEDSGQTWSVSLESIHDWNFGQHPSGDVYMAGRSGLARTTDHGATWEWLPVYPGIGFHGIAFNSLGHIFLGEETDWTIGHMNRSTDDGLTWERIFLGGNDIPYDFAVKPNDDMFAAAGAVYRSTDAGATWMSVNTGLDNVSVGHLAIDSRGYLFAGTYFDGLFVSSDNGDSWVHNAFDAATVHDIVITPEDRIFVSISGEGIYSSSDSGGTWNELNNGVTNRAIPSLAYVADGILLAGSWGSSFYRSTDYGETWTNLRAGLGISSAQWVESAGDGTVYAGVGGGGGVFKSSDNGMNWSQSGLEGSYILDRAMAVSPNGHIFVGLGEEGIFKSTNSGVTWSYVGLEGYAGEYFPFAVNYRGDIFVGRSTASVGVYRSTDDGTTWTLVGEEEGINDVSCIATGMNEGIFVGTFDSEIFRSTDNGDTWERKDTGINDLSIWALGMNINGDLFASGFWGPIYKSTDSGETWVLSNEGFPEKTAHDFLFTPSGHIYAATTGAGVYRSIDDGATWHEVNSGLGGIYVYSLAMDTSGYIYAGTSDAGVFRSRESVTTAQEFVTSLPTAFSLLQNYPNPFNPTTTISFAIPISSFVNLSVYNVVGQRVATLVSENLIPGSYTVHWDARSHPTSVYFYHIKASQFVETRKLVLAR